jgi:Arc/MetJ family transcription regulator
MNILALTIYALEKTVRTTFDIDDELLAKATKYVGLTEKTAVVHEALRALIQRELPAALPRAAEAMLGPLRVCGDVALCQIVPIVDQRDITSIVAPAQAGPNSRVKLDPRLRGDDEP